VPADKDLSNAKLKGADLSSCDLSGINLSSADLSKAKLKGTVLQSAHLSKCDLSGADLTGADLREAKLEGINLRDANLCAAILHAAQAARPATTLSVPVSKGNFFNNADNFKGGHPVVFALTAPRALTLKRVTLCNTFGDGDGNDAYCGKTMEVQTGPSATGPWTSVVKFTSLQTKQEQTFAAAPDAPLLAGFVKVLVHDTYGGNAIGVMDEMMWRRTYGFNTWSSYVKSMALEGEAWG
jgi:hypothetical protein